MDDAMDRSGKLPPPPPADWRLRVWGQVEREAQWSWEEFALLPAVERVLEVRGGSGSLDASRWRGVATRELLSRVRLRPTAAFVMLHAHGGHVCGLSLSSFASADALLAWGRDGRPLGMEQGGPVRFVARGPDGATCVERVRGLEFLNKPWPASHDWGQV